MPGLWGIPASGDISTKFLRWTVAWNVSDVSVCILERRILSAVADRRYRVSHTFDGTESVPLIILVLAVIDRRYKRMFVL